MWEMRSCFCANFGGKCWSLGWVLVVLWLLKGGAVAADDGFSRAPYVQLATPSGIQVVWRTVERMDPVVRYGLTMGELGGAVATGAIRERKVAKDEKELESDRGRLHSGPKGTRQYEAAVTGLQPDTRYYYAIYDGEKRLTPEDASYHFRTMPEAGVSKAAYFWVVGDSGTGKERQSEVHEAMQQG